jgi:Raf kinase inhibitor-like YbhB/YbcL family protein
MQVSSPSFAAGASIPARFTCKGRDVNPALAISDIPVGTKALAIIVDDPDAPVGLWTHWTAWDLQPLASIAEAANVAGVGGVEGTTTAKTIGYHGPCPPSGTHRYFFRIHALSGRLGLPRGATRGELDQALKGRVLAEASLMGTFTKT